MASIVALKCPNCGSSLERGNLKCQYCGTESIFLPDGSGLRFRSENACPKCGATNERSSWFCANCSTVLTKDIDILKEQQRKIKFEQDRNKSQFMPPELRKRIEPDEFIYYTFAKPSLTDCYSITDKRLAKIRHGVYQEAKLSEIISVGPPEVKQGFGFFIPNISLFFEVNTFNGTMVLDGFPQEQAAMCGTVHAWVEKALQNHNSRRKDVRALILSLKLP